MLGRELTPVDCSRHVVRWRQRSVDGRWEFQFSIVSDDDDLNMKNKQFESPSLRRGVEKISQPL